MMAETKTRCCQLDPSLSRLTVQAFSGGMLSFLGHNPTFAVREFAGELRFEPDDLTCGNLEITAQARSLDLLDNVRPADRNEIQNRMQREALESAAYPVIRFHEGQFNGVREADNQYRVRVRGSLSLHGVTNLLQVNVLMIHFTDGIRVRGEFPLSQAAYGIRPISALGGAIQLKDRLQVSFDLAARPQEAS